MGFRIRKSVNLGGGFRINMSKSGVGYSWGVPGYRVTKIANGRMRKTYSVKGTGLSYVEESSAKGNKKRQHYINNQNVEGGYTDIQSAEIEQLNCGEYNQLTGRLKRLLWLNTFSSIAILLIFLGPVGILGFIIGIILKILLHTKWKLRFEYEVEPGMLDEYNKHREMLLSLNNNDKIWQILQFQNATNLKANGGAARNIRRKPFKFTNKIPYYINTNIDVFQMKLNKETLIILPDKVIIIRGLKVAAIDFSSLDIKIDAVKFIENQVVPKDATIIDYTWQFVNKNGTPDKRYKNNRKLPVCLYGDVFITSKEGINVELQCSSIEKVKASASIAVNN